MAIDREGDGNFRPATPLSAPLEPLSYLKFGTYANRVSDYDFSLEPATLLAAPQAPPFKCSYVFLQEAQWVPQGLPTTLSGMGLST